MKCCALHRKLHRRPCKMLLRARVMCWLALMLAEEVLGEVALGSLGEAATVGKAGSPIRT